MENRKREEEIVQASMEIILHAGDARESNVEVIKAISEGDYDKAREFLREAEKDITIAHRAQTDKIQAETRGEKEEYSLLFAHAQDTLMTINSEIILVKNLMKVFQNYENRISELEEILHKIHE